MDDLLLCHLIRYVPDVNDFRRFAAVALVELNLESEEKKGRIPRESSDKTSCDNLMSH